MTTENAPTFEEALAQLEKIVERLQRDDVPLDEAVSLYTQGSKLSERCDELLTGAELRVQQLTQAVRERFVEYRPESDDSYLPEEDATRP